MNKRLASFCKAILKTRCLSDKAEQIYMQILHRKPSHRPSLNALGVLAFNRGDDDLAEMCFATALMLDPGHPGLKRNLETVRHRKLEKLK